MNFNYNPHPGLTSRCAIILHSSIFWFTPRIGFGYNPTSPVSGRRSSFILHLSVDSSLVHLNNLFWNLGTYPEVMPKKASRCLELENFS